MGLKRRARRCVVMVRGEGVEPGHHVAKRAEALRENGVEAPAVDAESASARPDTGCGSERGTAPSRQAGGALKAAVVAALDADDPEFAAELLDLLRRRTGVPEGVVDLGAERRARRR